jgi:hypothetical protein
MTAATVPFAAPATRAPSLRLLGTIGILASPMLLAEVPLMRLADGDAQRDVVMGLCSLVYVAGFAASAVGLRTLRATGDGRGARLAFGVQMLGLALAALWAAQYVAAPGLARTTFLHVTDAAWPLSHLFMLVVGGMVLRAGRLRGWRRFPALLCGLALPLMVVLRAVGAPPPVAQHSFPLLATLGFGLLGLAVRSAAGSTHRLPS